MNLATFTGTVVRISIVQDRTCRLLDTFTGRILASAFVGREKKTVLILPFVLGTEISPGIEPDNLR